MKFNDTELRKAISIMKPDGQLFEVRLIDGKWNASGYFTSADTLVKELEKVKARVNMNVYITLNHVTDECYSRKQRDRFIESFKDALPTTSDNNIDAVDWLMVDLDPVRVAGTSSSKEQLEKARIKAIKIYKYLKEKGWSEPVAALSGNGYHLLYSVALLNNKENVELLKNCLLALNMIFADKEIDIDLKTFNPARICKLYGTMAQKGANTEDRPHRMSKILSVPAEIKPTEKGMLQELIKMLPSEDKPQKYNRYNPKEFNLQDWIDGHGIRVKEKTGWNGGTKWILEECPFNPEHKGRDASIIQTSDGKICFNCFHNSCANNHWKELRLKYEPDAYARVSDAPRPNYKNEFSVVLPDDYSTSNDKAALLEKSGVPVFYTTEQIRLMKAPEEEYIKTGIAVIDKKMRGLKKGYVSVISGLRACGKSSIISQLSLETVTQGYKVALFSGELTAKNTYTWLMLQAAGIGNVKPTQYENFYAVDKAKEIIISKWLEDKIYIYNNDYGNNFQILRNYLNECVKKHKVDLIILDNLMALNISMMDKDKYQQQSAFVGSLEDFAKENNVHVVFVAHPRKSLGFLRLDDISGSNDIVNRVDNAFIIHRVNADFKRLSKEMFKWKDDNPCYQCNNVIEICKDRETGIQDEFIPLWFEKETKRLKNDKYEAKAYGWDKSQGWEQLPLDVECPF